MRKEEAIEKLKYYINLLDFRPKENPDSPLELTRYFDEWKQVLETVLNYTKELEEEKDKLKERLVERITYCNELEKDLFENCENYVVNKSKIRDKIEELEKEKQKYDNEIRIYTMRESFDFQEMILKELLEEE